MCKNNPLLVKFIIVSNTFLGLENINVLITCLSANVCHKLKKKTSINI